MSNFKYKAGDKVKVTIPAFENILGVHEWIVSGLAKEQPNDGRVRYACYRADDANKMSFAFFDGEIVPA